MKRKFDADFKRIAVQKVLDGQPVASLARELGVSEGLIHTAVGKKPFFKMAAQLKARLN